MKLAYLSFIELDIPNACLIHTREIAEQLSALGHEVHVFLPMPINANKWENVQHHWVHFWGFDFLRRVCFLVEACIRLTLAHRRHRFDVLYLRELEHPKLPVWLCHWLKIPLFVEVNGWLLDDLKLLGSDEHKLEIARRGQRALFSAARGIVVSTVGNSINIIREYSIPMERVMVQELGVNPDLFTCMDRRQARKELGLLDNAVLLLFAGSFHSHHDLRTLIRAFARVRLKISGIRLVLVGDGVQKKKAEEWVQNEGISKGVLFAGSRQYEEMPFWFAAADMLVLPLLKDKVEQQNGAYATKLWEAMSAGTGVVATDLPQSSSYTLLADKAWIAPPEDANALADVLLSALQNREEREARVERARHYVLEHRTWRQAAVNTLAFIERRLRE